ncbi:MULTISPECIES: DegT/DnrJ/EryC1/StrS family aminotransferase [Protofrankia]|uniref:DegT/DnrJ/EryC1/StrS family aminotransferase n=1 Tax=Protofrankia TaxID=2994361 RepID=UPI00069B0C2A|nr:MULTISPECIES: DegT/DnrJ/EryC1/StrS family aminotransferase [Protofrankia]ONH35213.1 DegT/DnrJ/EryC1/StrS aminotransferase [Protofrankia sp. BMG5.30]
MQSSRLRRRFADETALRHTSSERTDPGGQNRRIRSAVARLAHVDPGSVAPLETVRRTTGELPGLRVERYELRSPARDGIRAVLLAPTGPSRPRPAVLVSPGRRAVLEQVTGLEPPDHPDRNIAERLARVGLLTLTVDYGLDGGLPAALLSGRDEAAVLTQAFSLGSQPLLGALVEDALGALGWLRGHPDADPDRIGLFGHSLGAAVALHTALLQDGEPLPLCAASHLGSYPLLHGELLSGNPVAMLPGILRHADLPDLYAALCPAPLQVQYGTVDPTLSRQDTESAAEQLRKAYALGSAQHRLEVLDLPMGHATDPERATAFFLDALGKDGAQPAVPVPALRLRFDVAARREVTDRVDEALASGALTLGPQLAEFEARVEPWVGREAAAVSSGSAALEIAFRIIGVAGRTVLVPVNTFFATAAAAVRAGAVVDFVDMELDGLGLDPASLARALDRHPDVAAVTVVHIGGVISPAIHQVAATCRARGIPLVEDAAHAFGSRLDGAPAGTFGTYGAFSLYPTKVLTSAEGGILTAPGPAELNTVRRLRDHGRVAYEAGLHDCPGSNWRMSEVHAAIGLAQLERFDAATRARHALAARYDEHLSGVPGLRRYDVPAGVTANGYKYLAYLPDGVDRATLKARLRTHHGVALAGEVYDTLLCEQPYFTAQGAPPARDFPQARWFAAHHICLPLYPSITPDQQQRTLAALRTELANLC